MTDFKSVDELDKYLLTRSYITGYSLSNDDKIAFNKLTGPPSQATHPNVYRWALHIAALYGTSVSFLGSASSSSVETKILDNRSNIIAAFAPAPAPATSKPTAADDDLDDMFGDEGEGEALNDEGETAAEAAATKARQERMAQALKLKEEKEAKEGKVKKEKEKAVEKSLVVLEVKPWEADTDLKMVWEKIKEYKQEGLVWGETYKLEPVAYGIMKLVMTATIVDSLVLMDDVTENIEALEEFVQSVTVASMNKIS